MLCIRFDSQPRRHLISLSLAFSLSRSYAFFYAACVSLYLSFPLSPLVAAVLCLADLIWSKSTYFTSSLVCPIMYNVVECSLPCVTTDSAVGAVWKGAFPSFIYRSDALNSQPAELGLHLWNPMHISDWIIVRNFTVDLFWAGMRLDFISIFYTLLWYT